ncbi:DDE transposase [Campylobacterota bacterium]|nr:DDE transposase [Campylobacterota bacterium]
MKKLLAIFVLTVASFAISQPSLFSPIGAPKNEMINLNIKSCDESCLVKLLNDERYFSFLARYKSGVGAQALSSEYQRYATFLNLRMPQVLGERIAVLIPSEAVGRYSIIVTNSVSAYLLSRGKPFEIKVFDSIDEHYDNLRREIEKIESEGFSRAIAVLTPDGASLLASISTNLEIFIPTINKNELPNAGANLFFGGIDYAAQLNELSKYHSGENLILFDETTPLSRRISQLSDQMPVPPRHITLSTPRVNFTQLFKSEQIENGSVVLLNTQPVRTSLILSQLTFHDLDIPKTLSTQINYSPMLLTLTQNEDVKNFYVVSAIGESDPQLRELNALLHNDLRYDRIAYATGAMTALIVQRDTMNFSARIGGFGLDLIDNQIVYPITVWRIRNGRFVAVPPSETPQETERAESQIEPEADEQQFLAPADEDSLLLLEE